MPNQIPRSSEIIGAGLDSLSGFGPGTPRLPAFAYANNGVGRWGDIFAGMDAQCALLLSRLADECVSARLRLAKGPSLVDLARSEFETDPDLGSTTGIGTMTLVRASGPAGSIPKGTRMKRAAKQSAVPPIPAAVYTSAQDVPVGFNATSVTVPITAVEPGTAPNQADIYTSPVVSLIDTLFDTSFAISTFECSGGAAAKGDAELVNEAYAFVTGQFAPTIGAILAGALRGTGVRHAAVIDVTSALQGGFIVPAAYTGVLVADGAWASGPTWLSRVSQQIVDPATGFLGVGPRIIVTSPSNTLVRVTATVMLADAGYAAYTADITKAIGSSLTSYFNDRPDWYTFRLSGIRNAISKADARIRTCSTAAVRALPGDFALSEPPATPQALTNGLIANHYYLVPNGVTVTYLTPT